MSRATQTYGRYNLRKIAGKTTVALVISEENADKITMAMVPYAWFTQVNDELMDLKG
jgi:hypothetical protein